MCGRFTLTTELREVAERFCVSPSATADFKPRFNIAPSQSVIVIGDDGRRSLQSMQWGLIPHWAKDPALGNRRINARSETLVEKPSFCEALKKRRCLIPADGFYEWRKVGKAKQPVRIVLKSRAPFGLAGLWDRWISLEKKEILTCTIITTAANELIQEFHDRMPALLQRDDEARWLDPAQTDPLQLLPLLKPYPSELMEYYPVSRQVNSPRVDEPGNIEPLVDGRMP